MSRRLRCAPGRRIPARGALTLVELLLVLAIIGVVTMVTVPSFVRSMRGNQLRAASRSVVTAGRYARSMALLKQKDMLVSFDVEGGRISVQEVAGRSPPSGPDPDDSAVFGADAGPEGAPQEDSDPAAAVRAAGSTLLTRALDGVTIEEVDIEEAGDVDSEAAPAVLYRDNGRCTPYTVRLADGHGGGVTIEVDAFGTPRTDAEQG